MQNYFSILIRGEDIHNPIIIFVHGGPGASEMPYALEYQKLLETKFTVVHYDQRGTGKSYYFTEDYSNLTPDLLVEDLLALTDYIKNRFNKDKVILAGHSYGTYIGIQAAHRAPTKYEAYIGIGQMGDTVESEQQILQYVMKEAKAAGEAKDVQKLENVANKVNNGEMFTPRQYVIKYGGAARLIDNPDGHVLKTMFSREYNLLDIIRYYFGILKSQTMLLQDLNKDLLPTFITSLDLPTYFIMGKYDYMTTYEAALDYFNKLQAENKQFVTFEQSAHYPQFEEQEKFFKWMVDTFSE